MNLRKFSEYEEYIHYNWYFTSQCVNIPHRVVLGECITINEMYFWFWNFLISI